MVTTVILVVDDEEAIRDLVADVLTAEGYTVATAADGREALNIIVRVQPSLILLDMHMPLLGGGAFVAALAARGIAVPTILFSAAANLATHARDIGAVAFVPKPFEIAHLLRTVQRHALA